MESRNNSESDEDQLSSWLKALLSCGCLTFVLLISTVIMNAVDQNTDDWNGSGLVQELWKVVAAFTGLTAAILLCFLWFNCNVDRRDFTTTPQPATHENCTYYIAAQGVGEVM